MLSFDSFVVLLVRVKLIEIGKTLKNNQRL